VLACTLLRFARGPLLDPVQLLLADARDLLGDLALGVDLGLLLTLVEPGA